MQSLKYIFCLSLLSPLATAQSSNQANCTVFNWDHDEAYLKTYPPQRVSAAETCSSNANLTCALTAAGDASYTARTNLTSLSATAFATVVDETVGNATLTEEFSDSTVGAIDGTRLLRPGQSAYLNFTAYQYCYTGTVEGCTSGVENRTAVEACAPLYHTSADNSVVMDGLLTVVNVSQGQVGQLKDPYENQQRGEGGVVSVGRAEWGVVMLGILGVLMV
ncbi:uncharacterized protein BO66DRAFT_392424 [Aspergillus aculeatinus CBS 121060]|uniref:Uncharacterized protein n=1 Tax=Aspergillus aculeatinus CBS 121060 TaxID=1448322 RepID=A0ACD1H7T4_9EURO|nr:hypothetical protein BO66DRAFT_392424 [Aspergillus aculeatinus CBS 121060]RAH69473.1 hypothetical protein BO66DRAFT_392424 [Aspergillus aculeatinus CBS 121060]